MGTEEDGDDMPLRKLVERRKYGTPHDPRVTATLTIVSMVLAGLVTAAIIALFNLNSNVAVLLARPAGVPREEYARDTIRRDDDSNNLKQEISQLRIAVDKLREDEVLNPPPPKRTAR